MTAVVDILSEREQKKFTTKEIAAKVGVSEACLYRHFKSKAEILQKLVDFCDQSFVTMFSHIDGIANITMQKRAQTKVQALLSFAEMNPGLSRILTMEGLVYEAVDVQRQMHLVIDQAEVSIKQTLKLAIVNREIPADSNTLMAANVMMSFVEGRWRRYTQSGFKAKPTEGLVMAQSMLTALLRPL